MSARVEPVFDVIRLRTPALRACGGAELSPLFCSETGAQGRNSHSTLHARNSLKIKLHQNQRAERPGASSHAEFCYLISNLQPRTSTIYPRQRSSRNASKLFKTKDRMPFYPRQFLSPIRASNQPSTRRSAASLNSLDGRASSQNSNRPTAQRAHSLTKPPIATYNQSSSIQLEAACTL